MSQVSKERLRKLTLPVDPHFERFFGTLCTTRSVSMGGPLALDATKAMQLAPLFGYEPTQELLLTIQYIDGAWLKAMSDMRKREEKGAKKV